MKQVNSHTGILITALLLLTGMAVGQAEEMRRCKREIVESYNLNGYLSQRPMNMYVCPAIKMSCCSMYDQFMMFSTWKDKIKPKLLKYYDGIRKKYVDMKELITAVFNLDINKLVNDLPQTDGQKEGILNKITIVRSQNHNKMLDDMLLMHHKNSMYMMKLRSAFFCTICDFEMQSLINIPNKIFPITESTCQDIASNTIEYSFYLNVKLGQYLQDLSDILSNFGSRESDKPVQIKYFDSIKRSVRSCARAVESGTNFRACRSYCRHYKFNANSPVIEGYQVFFNEILNSVAVFLKSYAPVSDRRVLEEAFSIPDSNTKLSRIELENGRNLQDELPFPSFTMKDIKGRKDIYDEDSVDPNFDEFVLNEMFNFNQDYEDDRQRGYVNFVKNKIINFDTEYDYENGDDSDIFKTSTNIIIDLENYKTRVLAPGVDIVKHSETTNIDNSMRELITHLKNKSKYKILYEKLDPPLLEQVNNIDNENVKNFHRDNFLYYKDFSANLKKEEIIGNMMNQNVPPAPLKSTATQTSSGQTSSTQNQSSAQSSSAHSPSASKVQSR